MPIVSSMPSTDEFTAAIGTFAGSNLNKNAFSILNSDSLGLYGKPNAIVRPVQRRELYDSNDDVTATIVIDGMGEMNSNLPHKNTISSKSDSDLRFSTELDTKLRKLQNQTKNSSKYVIIITLENIEILMRIGIKENETSNSNYIKKIEMVFEGLQQVCNIQLK